MDSIRTDNFKRLLGIGRRYVTLQLDYARLTAAEKLTLLLATTAFYALVVIIGMATLFFISIGIGHWLAVTVAPYTAYLFVSAFYLVLSVVLIVFKRRLIFNPVARFISRLLLKTPDNDHE